MENDGICSRIAELRAQQSAKAELSRDQFRQFLINVILAKPEQASMDKPPEGVEIVNLVHDEVDAIVTGERLKATADVITRAFQETFAGFYPSSKLAPEIKFSCGPSWGETVPIDDTGT